MNMLSIKMQLNRQCVLGWF